MSWFYKRYQIIRKNICYKSFHWLQSHTIRKEFNDFTTILYWFWKFTFKMVESHKISVKYLQLSDLCCFSDCISVLNAVNDADCRVRLKKRSILCILTVEKSCSEKPLFWLLFIDDAPHAYLWSVFCWKNREMWRFLST